MNTGADDDSRSTPTFALTKSSARVTPLAAMTSRPANASRATLTIQFPPSLMLQPFGDRLIPSDKRALLLQLVLQFSGINVTRQYIAIKRERRRRPRGFPHRKAGAGDARGRLAVMGHRGAAPGHQQIVDAFGNKHPIGQFVKPARFRDRRKLEDHLARDMGFHRPAIDADRIVERRAAEHVLT